MHEEQESVGKVLEFILPRGIIHLTFMKERRCFLRPTITNITQRRIKEKRFTAHWVKRQYSYSGPGAHLDPAMFTAGATSLVRKGPVRLRWCIHKSTFGLSLLTAGEFYKV